MDKLFPKRLEKQENIRFPEDELNSWNSIFRQKPMKRIKIHKIRTMFVYLKFCCPATSSMVVNSLNLIIRQNDILLPCLPLNSYVILDRILHFSSPDFPNYNWNFKYFSHWTVPRLQIVYEGKNKIKESAWNILINISIVDYDNNAADDN